MEDLKFTLDDETLSVDGENIVLSDDEIKLSKPKQKTKNLNPLIGLTTEKHKT